MSVHDGHIIVPLGLVRWCDTCQSQIGRAPLRGAPAPVRSDGPS